MPTTSGSGLQHKVARACCVLLVGLVMSDCDTDHNAADTDAAVVSAITDGAVPLDAANSGGDATHAGSGAAGGGNGTAGSTAAGSGGATGGASAAGANGEAGSAGTVDSTATAGSDGTSGAGAAAVGGGSGGGDAAGQGGAGGESGHDAGALEPPVPPATSVVLSLSAQAATDLSGFAAQLDNLKTLTSAQLLDKHKPKQLETLGYDPTTAQGLDLIQASALKLDEAELATLKKRGFVVSTRQQFPHMLYGYDTIYTADLPVYVSADSILDAVHRSYDPLLEDAEEYVLSAELDALLDAMREALATSTGSNRLRAEADLYLAVAKELLHDDAVAPVAGADGARIEAIVALAKGAQGVHPIEIFGGTRDVDFSQFAPRGHYANSWSLGGYFRAMMWLGRIDLRLIDTNSDGRQLFHRYQFDTMILLRELLDAEAFTHYRRIERTLQTFFGESDYLGFSDLDAWLRSRGYRPAEPGNLSQINAESDQFLAQAIIASQYGVQRIPSQLIAKANASGTALLFDRSFALFGQRYSVDSHVLANVVHSHAPGRLMPDPLDAAYAALGNDQAAQLLKPQLEQYNYAGALESMRLLVDAHAQSYWDGSLYTLWLQSLRALSPNMLPADSKAAGLPTLAATEAWGRRLLNTQLASWAELRHDANLYAVQSYSPGGVCEFPDAYVDPYPEFYAPLIRFAERGASWADTLADVPEYDRVQQMRLYFDHLRTTLSMLRGMAESERNGVSFTVDQLAFINRAVHNTRDPMCNFPAVYTGWYSELNYTGVHQYYRMLNDFRPTIADIHTQPTDLDGHELGRILHVGTGYVRLMVVTNDVCGSVTAYAGLAFSYYQQVTDNWQRLTDQAWVNSVQATPPPAEVPWATEFLSSTP